jgi:tol-pal system protein YbgF
MKCHGGPVRRLSLLAVLAVVLAAGCASTPPGPDPVQVKLDDHEARLARLERGVEGQVEAAQRIDELQNTVRQLRGRIEELEHSIEALSKQQRDLYADLDKRLSASAAPPGGAGAAGGTAGPGGGEGGAATGGAAPGSTAANAGAPGGAPPSSVEQAVYTQAFDALKAGSYSVAIAGFKDFLSAYPASPLAENAQYWLGEAYYVNHDYEAAAPAFRAVLKKWPDSRKAPDALLKLGYTQAAQKQYGAARATFNEVVRRYPGSEPARLAANRLRRLSAGAAGE